MTRKLHPRQSISLIIFILISLIIGLPLKPRRASAQETHLTHLPLVLKNPQPEFLTFLPLIYHRGQPITSTSYYLKTVDGPFLYNLGCELGLRDKNTPGQQDSVAVLDFSYPICTEGAPFGAELFGFGPVPFDDIGAAVKNFGLGYYTCSGTDRDSRLVVGAGTNNKPYSCDGNNEGAAHGAAWAAMVNEINDWFIQQGIFHQVQAYAASDMELGWNGPAWTRAWLDAYDEANAYPMLHFGDAAGCPYDDRPYLNCGTASFPEWEQEDLWYVSWGSPPALPLPLIYLTNGIHAKQWAFLSCYSVSQHGARMDFTGVFTQYQACQQWGCNGTDNTPEEAYVQLYTELNKDPATSQVLRWKTDIRWILNEEIPLWRTTSWPSAQPGTSGTVPQDPIQALETSLENPELSQGMKTSLEEKLHLLKAIAARAAESRNTAGSKDASLRTAIIFTQDPVFQQGIFPGGDSLILPYRTPVSNYWQKRTAYGYIQIVAGLSPTNPGQGALFYLLTTPDKSLTEFDLLLAPEGVGALRITAATDGGLLLSAQTGESLFFDLEQKQWEKLSD